MNKMPNTSLHKRSEKEKEELWNRWRSLVNMTVSEIKRFLESEEGQDAGLSEDEASSQGIKRGRDSARALIRMIPKGRSFKSANENWSAADWDWAGRQVSFISRMRGVDGPLFDDKDRMTRKMKSLLIWGHDPRKPLRKASVEKVVRRIDGEYCVIGEASGKNFGCYATKEEAEERLRQIERFSDDDSKKGVSKGLPTEVAESGIHVHTLDRNRMTTLGDGAHMHLFKLPDGSLVLTEEDGVHSHEMGNQFSNVIEGGQHRHVVVIDGERFTTEYDGAHGHQLQTFSTAFDGLHTHTLTLSDGTVVESMSPGDFFGELGSPEYSDGAPAPPASQLALLNEAVRRGANEAVGVVEMTDDEAAYLKRAQSLAKYLSDGKADEFSNACLQYVDKPRASVDLLKGFSSAMKSLSFELGRIQAGKVESAEADSAISAAVELQECLSRLPRSRFLKVQGYADALAALDAMLASLSSPSVGPERRVAEDAEVALKSVAKKLSGIEVSAPFLQLEKGQGGIRVIVDPEAVDAVVAGVEKAIAYALPDEDQVAVAKDAINLGEVLELGRLKVKFEPGTKVVGVEDVGKSAWVPGGPVEGSLSVHQVCNSLMTTLRVPLREGHIAWHMALPCWETETDAGVVAKAFDQFGSLHTKSMDRPFDASFETSASDFWLGIEDHTFLEGEIGATRKSRGRVVNAERPRIEFGVQTEDRVEYFITGEKLCGTLVFKRLVRDGVAQWQGRIQDDLVPAVLKEAAVKEGYTPEKGRSGMPASLEAVTPSKYRFWEVEDPAARARVRDALVKSEFFTKDNIRISGNEYVRTVSKVFKYKPKQDEESTAKAVYPWWDIDRAADELVQHEQPRVYVPELEEAPRKKAPVEEEPKRGVVVIDLAGEGKEETVAKAMSSSTRTVIAADDTPANRQVLIKHSRPFTMDSVPGKVMATNFQTTLPVDWVETLDFADVVGPCIPDSIADLGKRDVRIVAQKNEHEERFVLGVVLEPETVDSQSDIYSAEEIRNAAHRFMEDYRAVGLQHKEIITGQVEILETYISPVDMVVEGQPVKKGTWLMAFRVNSEDLWRAVKEGKLTGLSIGGSALRQQEG